MNILERIFQRGRIISDPLIYSNGIEFQVLHEMESYTITYSSKNGVIGMHTDGHGDYYFGGESEQRLKWKDAARRIFVNGGHIKWSEFTKGFWEGMEYIPGGLQFCIEDSEGKETGYVTIYEHTLLEIKSNAFFRDANLQFIEDKKKWDLDEAKKQLGRSLNDEELSELDWIRFTEILQGG